MSQSVHVHIYITHGYHVVSIGQDRIVDVGLCAHHNQRTQIFQCSLTSMTQCVT